MTMRRRCGGVAVVMLMLALGVSPGAAQTFTPRDESPQDFPDHPGRALPSPDRVRPAPIPLQRRPSHRCQHHVGQLLPALRWRDDLGQGLLALHRLPVQRGLLLIKSALMAGAYNTCSRE